jgi:hypothetical protein
MFKLSDLKKANADASKQQSKQKTEAGGRLKGKLINKTDEKEIISSTSDDSLLVTPPVLAVPLTEELSIDVTESSSVTLLEASTKSEKQNLKRTKKHDDEEHEEI